MSIWKHTHLVLLSAVLVGCGGGGGGGSSIADTGVGGSGSGGGGGSSPTSFGFDTGVGGSGGAVGPVQDFGSIIVNDLTLNIDSAEFEIEGEAAGIGSVGQNRLKQGQQVVVPFDVDSFDGVEYEAVEVFYRSNVKGPLTSISVIDLTTGSADLVVLGQSVRTNAVTRFSGGAALDTLAPGDELEVSGAPNADGVLVATFIELKATAAEALAGNGLAEYKVIGEVTDDDGTTFRIGSLTVNYAGASIDFDPAEGQEVEVRIDPADFDPATPGTAPAAEVEDLPDLRVESSAEVEFEGFITGFSETADPNVKNFVLNGVPVTTTDITVYEDGEVANLADNVKVEVEGRVNAEGVLVAAKVEIESTNAVRAESTVLTVDLTTRSLDTQAAPGLFFQISDLTELEDDLAGVEPFTLGDLGNGDYVEIRGFLDGDTVKAVELDRDDPRDDHRIRAPLIEAPGIEGGVGTLVLLGGITLQATDAVTSFEDADGGGVATLAEFFALLEVGTFVEARWDVFTSNAATVDELSIEADD